MCLREGEWEASICERLIAPGRRAAGYIIHYHTGTSFTYASLATAAGESSRLPPLTPHLASWWGGRGDPSCVVFVLGLCGVVPVGDEIYEWEEIECCELCWR